MGRKRDVGGKGGGAAGALAGRVVDPIAAMAQQLAPPPVLPEVPAVLRKKWELAAASVLQAFGADGDAWQLPWRQLARNAQACVPSSPDTSRVEREARLRQIAAAERIGGPERAPGARGQVLRWLDVREHGVRRPGSHLLYRLEELTGAQLHALMGLRLALAEGLDFADPGGASDYVAKRVVAEGRRAQQPPQGAVRARAIRSLKDSIATDELADDPRSKEELRHLRRVQDIEDAASRTKLERDRRVVEQIRARYLPALDDGPKGAAGRVMDKIMKEDEVKRSRFFELLKIAKDARNTSR